MIILCQTFLKKLKINGIALFPFILVSHPESKHSQELINHEKIHIQQQLELGILLFYILYISEFLWGLLLFKNRGIAYQNISFEREAYSNDFDLSYLENRPFWNFRHYYSKKN